MKKIQCFQICPSSLFCGGYVIFKQNYGSMYMLHSTKSVEISNLGTCQAMTTLSKIPPSTPFIIILSPLIQNYIWDLRFYWQWLWRLLSSGMWYNGTGRYIYQLNRVTSQKTALFKVTLKTNKATVNMYLLTFACSYTYYSP